MRILFNIKNCRTATPTLSPRHPEPAPLDTSLAPTATVYSTPGDVTKRTTAKTRKW